MIATKELTLLDEACCPPLLDAPLNVGQAESLARALKVLADPTRLRLVSLIAARPNQEACVCEVVEPLGLSQPTVSHHLKVLHDAGLLWRERRGTWVHYGLQASALEPLVSALSPAS